MFAEEVFKRKVESRIGKTAVFLQSVRGLEVVTYEELLDSEAEKDYVVEFLTPTAFKKGDFDYPLPDPYLLIKSLINRWNYWSPFKFTIEEQKKLCRSLAVSGCWIRTKKVELFQETKLLGFTGRVFFFCRDSDVRSKVNALLRFAEFAGVGRKTTMGFGKVRCLR
ncbi:MAG: CRISPR-associated endoribonuclease Cas6 [Desulfurobacteriaceae bacterium]